MQMVGNVQKLRKCNTRIFGGYFDFVLLAV